VPVLAVAVLPDLLQVKAMLVVAEMLAGRMAAMPGAGGGVARAREYGSQRKGGNGGGEQGARGGHGLTGRDVGGLTREETHPGEIRPGGSHIAVCLHVAVGDVADVDVPRVVRAPHPARRIATVVEVAVVTVVVVAVVVVVMMAVVVVAMVVMAVMTMMAMAMTAAVPAAGRRVARGGEGRNSQHEGSGSGGEDSTLHFRLLLG